MPLAEMKYRGVVIVCCVQRKMQKQMRVLQSTVPASRALSSSRAGSPLVVVTTLDSYWPLPDVSLEGQWKKSVRQLRPDQAAFR